MLSRRGLPPFRRSVSLVAREYGVSANRPVLVAASAKGHPLLTGRVKMFSDWIERQGAYGRVGGW